MHVPLFLHASLLILIALMWKITPTSTSMDVCNLTNASMYCNCEMLHHKQTVTCFVFGEVTETDEVWGAFDQEKNTIELALRSHRHYQLSFIPKYTLSVLPELETITIHEGNIEVIASGTLSNLKKLVSLDMDRNEIKSLHRHSFSKLHMLKKLSLQDNQITELLADTFEGVEELEQLLLGINNISRMEACAFCNLHNLKELELFRNSITDLTEYTFRGLRYLSRLDLESNQLKILNEKVFDTLPRLRELNLNHNQLHYISPRAFLGLKSLVSLELSDNRLKRLPDNVFHHAPKLLSLNLLKNQMETVHTKLVEGMRNSLTQYFIFNFNDNPLKCGCDLSWIAKYLQKAKSQMFLKELSQVKCQPAKGGAVSVQLTEIKDCEKKAKNVIQEPTLSTLNSYSLGPKNAIPRYNPAQADEKSSSTHQPAENGVLIEESKDSATIVSKNKPELLCCIIFIYLIRFLLKN